MGEIRAEAYSVAGDRDTENPGRASCYLANAPDEFADAALIALEQRFNALLAELSALEQLCSDPKSCGFPDSSSGRTPMETCAQRHYHDEVATGQIDAILERLDPIERTIMAAPALTIAGLGVKARHAAYVVSHYWNAPIDKINWDAQAVRLLIEAVCDVAKVQLPFQKSNVG
jgi:hypothetical protein